MILILAGMVFIPVFCVEAYASTTTHPALTQEALKLFEYHYPQRQFTDAEKAIIEKGSADEDDPIYRSFSHFYDPIYEQGLWNFFSSAKKWARDTRAQAKLDLKYTALLANMTQKLFDSDTDFTFDRAVFEYVHKNKDRALEALGHILHLIEDMDVPAHTRDDSHILGDPLEVYADRFVKGRADVDNIAVGLIKENKKPVIDANLDDYFYNLALFSNQNFFSEDTILIEKYAEPIISYEKKDSVSGTNFGYKKIDNIDYKLVRIETLYKNKVFYKQYYVVDKDNLILSDNWNVLSKQAILYGAGVIKLFFDAVEEEKKTLALYDKNESWLGKTKNKISAGVLSLADGALERVSEIMERVKKRMGEIDPQDMLATVGEAGEKAAAGDKQVEVANEDRNRPVIPETKPEDPNSPELQRLALILREAERMVARLETGVADLEKTANQAVGGTVENLTAQAKESGPVARPIVEQQSFCGGGGSAPAPTPAPQESQTPEEETDATAANETTADTITTINSPALTSPENFSQFTVATIIFSGTASSTQIISTNFSSATTTTNQNHTWDLTLSDFPQGTTTIQFFAGDNEQNISDPTEIEIFVDIVVPDTTVPDAPSLQITQCDNSMSASSCLIAATTLDILWATTTSDADFAYFNLDENGAFSTTTATTTQITGLNDGDFTFSVATVDTNGNASATTTKIAKISQMPIVINEIAWAGTSSTNTSDEWIELYNCSDKDIDLSDWMFYSKDLVPFLSFSDAQDKIIEAHSYYLIERSADDDTVSDIAADFATSFSGWGGGLGNGFGLSNYGEHLILAYKKSNQATTTVDEVYFASDEGSWVDKADTCSYGNCRTLERYNPDYICANLSDCRSNWALSIEYSASFDLLNGLDVDGDIIRGTPKARNSINYKIAKGDTLFENKTLTQANSPYFVGKDGLTINADAILTIEPGAVIKSVFGDSSDIIVKGAIQSNGSTAEPVVFTSFYDDEYGGDMNGDGDCNAEGNVCPGIGDNFWSKVIFTSESYGSQFDHTIFRYGGRQFSSSALKAMVVLNGASANFTDSVFASSTTSGLHLTSAVSVIDNCVFKNNKKETGNYGFYAHNSDLNIQNSTFKNNQIGLCLSDSVGAIINSNTFNNHSGFPIKISGSPNITITGNTGENNETDGINIFGAMTNTIAITTLAYNPLPYIVGNSLTVSEDTALEIGPKTVFKFAKHGALWGNIGVNGFLKINGGAGEENQVLFTSIFDDGEIATNTIPKKGGINLNSASSTIENAEFRYLDVATDYKDMAKYQVVESFQSPIDLKNVIYKYNTWSIKTDTASTTVTRAENVTFVGPPSMSDIDGCSIVNNQLIYSAPE